MTKSRKEARDDNTQGRRARGGEIVEKGTYALSELMKESHRDKIVANCHHANACHVGRSRTFETLSEEAEDEDQSTAS